MKNNENSWNEQAQEKRLFDSIGNFFKEYNMGTLLHRCGIRKYRGVSPMIVLHCLFGLAFWGDNIFRHIVVKSRQPFGKDVVYDFLRSERFNWRKLLLLLAAKAISFIDGLTDVDRQQVLIIDDSVIERPRSKKVELLSKVYEAVEAGYDEALLRDDQGYIAEASGACFFMVREGKLYSPPSDNTLESITQQTIIDLATDMGIEVIRKRISREETYIADECFLTGTAAEVTPVREIDARIIGAGSRGPITERLQTAYFDVVAGKNPDYIQHLTYIN